MSESLIKDKLNSAKFKEVHNEHEWTPELDEALKKAVLTHYFNFNLVALELNEEAERLGIRFGATSGYITNETCRIRWFYLHCTRSLNQKAEQKKAKKEEKKASINNKENKEPVYETISIEQKNVISPPVIEKSFKEDYEEASISPLILQSQNNTENISENVMESKRYYTDLASKSMSQPSLNEDPQEEAASKKDYNEARELWEKKEIREDKKESQSYEEAAKYHWRQNIIPSRSHIDYLDTTKEDFAKYKTVDVEGHEINPSAFNIFRDSLKETSTELRNALKENLPDLNLNETTESDGDDEVVPLDFRTKLMNTDHDVVLQAKPLKLYKSDEDDNELIGDILRKSKVSDESKMLSMSSEDYLSKYKKEAFKDDDESVILIQPNLNIKEKLESIDLECNKASYMNNSINAPKVKVKPPKVNKRFRQDEDDLENMKKLNGISRRKKKVTIREDQTQVKYIPNRDDEYQPPSAKNDDLLDFAKIVQSHGMILDEIFGEEDEEEKGSSSSTQKQVYNPFNIIELLTGGGGVENLINQLDPQDDDACPDNDDNHTSENESAPMGAVVNEPTVDPEIAKINEMDKKEKAFRRSLVDASSASEDERGFKDHRNPALSSEEEMIETNKYKVRKQEENESTFKHGNCRTKAEGGSRKQVETHSTLTNSGLILQIPGLTTARSSDPKPYHEKDEKGEPIATPPDRVGYNLTPDSLLFKHNPNAPIPAAQPQSRPKTAGDSKVKKINYRGVWIETKADSDEDDTGDADAYYLNSQRELLKKKIKDQKSNQYEDLDKLKIEDLSTDTVNGEKVVKVDRDWGESMSGFDAYQTKKYKEDEDK